MKKIYNTARHLLASTSQHQSSMIKNANKYTFFSFENRKGSKQFTVFFSHPLPTRGMKAKLVRCMLCWVILRARPCACRPVPARRQGCPAPTASRSQPPYLLSPGLSPCSSMPAEEGTGPPSVLLSALEPWEGGSGPAGARVLPSVGGSGGWKAGDMCFLFRVPPRR